ncbi:uncharacterized protein LOC116249452 isoform X2 [Nymphaea colorata]|uniref:uncharacterized protein LOC116249452 isoform X2 n=1 Tax=Nymphaea colorata TaxID=210225 RepID=UPI00129EFB91|nr:uncharacterized protein LOC116249452 isoform X2 [Nymphaea colorata]
MMIKREDGKKGERKGRFFACFRPHADATDPPARKDTGSESVLALIAVSKKELIPVIVEPKAKQNMETLSLNSESSRRKKPCRFLGLKRAIFCNAKGRICDGKVQQDPRRSSESAKIFLVEPIPPVKPQEQERKLGQKSRTPSRAGRQILQRLPLVLGTGSRHPLLDPKAGKLQFRTGKKDPSRRWVRSSDYSAF